MAEDHVAPTKEELKAKAEAAAAELEEMDRLEEEAAQKASAKADSEETEEETTEPEEAEETEEVEETEEKPVTPKQPEETEETEKVDKSKFVASAKEAQILAAKNKKLMEAYEKAETIPDPTEDELKAEYADWDLMTDFEKKIAKKDMKRDRQFAVITEVNKEFKEMKAWQDKVEAFVADPENLTKNPKLEGKIEEFKLFATKPTRAGVPFEDLVAAFLYSIPAPQKHKGAMMETGGGGKEKIDPNKGKLSLEESRSLRKTDYAKWLSMLKAGKLAQDVS